MTTRIADVNGTRIAYRVAGEGPPLVLIMGYRLSAAAWPTAFVETLARQFTVVTLDNRGTGRSGKPVEGYALANLARDVGCLLDELKISHTHLLGYSMGGAIAQEFVRQFPERVSSLILCATMCGGVHATYAAAAVVRVMRDLDGLSPEQVARQIWKVTYAPDYLVRHPQLAEDQMRREIAWPTPLHAADLQFQAFAEFDGSKSLPDIRCPSLVLTGGLDQLIPPQNSTMMAKLIPGAKLIVMPRGGHRVLWESTEECVGHIMTFLDLVAHAATPDRYAVDRRANAPAAFQSLLSIAGFFMTWPMALTRAGFESAGVALRIMTMGSASRFGDGKPVILAAAWPGSSLALQPLFAWLKASGYRPVIADVCIDFDDPAQAENLSNKVRDAARRIARKAVLITHAAGMVPAMRTAASNRNWISDVVVLDATYPPDSRGLRMHVVSSRCLMLPSLTILPRVLRDIGIELIHETDDQAGQISAPHRNSDGQD